MEGYVSKMERLVTNALDARRLASAGAAAGGFLGSREGGRGPGPGDVSSTVKLAEILWQSLTEVRRLAMPQSACRPICTALALVAAEEHHQERSSQSAL